MTGPPLISLVLAAPLTAASKRKPRLLHAVDGPAIAAASVKGVTGTAVCGARHVRVLHFGDEVLPWPPRVRDLTDGFERCGDCWEQTGRPKPSSHWMRRRKDVA